MATPEQPHDVITTQSETVQQQIMNFNDSSPQEELTFDYIQDPTFDDGNANDHSLAEYFSRPVRIANITWAEGASLSTGLSPWLLYFNNTYVKKKIDNYGLLRCNLKVKLMINSSPFYYSLGMMSYHPLPILSGHNLPGGAGTITRLVTHSQRPKIFFSPQDSQGGTMTLPFFHFKNWLRVRVADDFSEMGTLNLDSFTELRNSNGVVGGNVSIQVYAWAEDVKLSAPTAGLALQSQIQTFSEYGDENVDLCFLCEQPYDDCECEIDTILDSSMRLTCDHQTYGCLKAATSLFRSVSRIFMKKRSYQPVTEFALQSGLSNFVSKQGNNVMNIIKETTGVKDEYGKGPVSKMASNVASFAGYLDNVPMIKPFATATSFVAEATGRIASYFGWSNPPIIDDVHAYRSTIFPNFASPEISNPTEKLTLDPKNELTVDSRTVGLDGTDELTIPSITQRECYLGSFGMTQANASETLIWSSSVRPSQSWWDSTISGWAATPMAHISQMFQYWRGDLIFRFKFIATKYHNGRVIISWDPYTDITAITDSETVNYTQVYDLSEGCDVEMRIPYMQETPFLKTSPFVTKYSSITPQTGVLHLDNGALTVRVLNELTAPDASSSIDCAVFVRAADNFELAAPQEIPRYSYFAPQSKLQKFEFQSEVTKESSLESSRMTNQVDPSDHLYMVNMGERVKSIRTLLRRSAWSSTLRPTPVTSIPSEVDSYTLASVLSRYPLQYGYDPDGVHKTSLLIPFNYSSVHPISYVAPCFIGQRGGTVISVNPSTNGIVNTLVLNRSQTAKTLANYRNYAANGSTDSQVNRQIIDKNSALDVAGGSMTNIRTAAGLQSHVPFYSRFRFDDTDPKQFREGNPILGTDTDSVTLATHCAGLSTDIQNTRYELYYGAGIDYNLFFYLNVPVLYDQSTLPAPITP